MRLLLLEDDPRLAGAVRSWMGHSGIQVDWIVAGAEAEAALRGGGYDCLLLDLGLPDLSGEEVLRRIRAAGIEIPVVVITARELVQDRVRLLDLGADDFLVKPVHLDELSARVRTVLRRRQGEARGEGELRHGALRVVSATRTVMLDGSYVALTTKEFWVLETLLRNKDRVLTREQLEEALYGWADEVGSNTVEVHVHHLRRKLGAELIKTVRGVGYTLRQEP
jgi:two-component system, OmpR family, response regulator QseB